MGTNSSENRGYISQFTSFQGQIPTLKASISSYITSKLPILHFSHDTASRPINTFPSIPSLVPLLSRDGKPRHILVIANPISGQNKSLEYYEQNLKPKLDLCGTFDLFIFNLYMIAVNLLKF